MARSVHCKTRPVLGRHGKGRTLRRPYGGAMQPCRPGQGWARRRISLAAFPRLDDGVLRMETAVPQDESFCPFSLQNYSIAVACYPAYPSVDGGKKILSNSAVPWLPCSIKCRPSMYRSASTPTNPLGLETAPAPGDHVHSAHASAAFSGHGKELRSTSSSQQGNYCCFFCGSPYGSLVWFIIRIF